MINSYDDLSPVQLDVLKEIGNIGSLTGVLICRCRR